MLKINPQQPIDAARSAVTGTPPGQEAAADRGELQAATAASAVELLADGNIKLLLDALGKTLGQYQRLARELPPMVAGEAETLAREALGADDTLPQGLPALARGARGGTEALSALAAQLEASAASGGSYAGLPAESLRKAGHTLREMVAVLPPPGPPAADTAGDQRQLAMAVPLFFADGRAYPAYIHVSQDRERTGGDAAAIRETWLRLCVATDNLGLADMVFHLHSRQQLSIRVSFSDREAVEEFRRALPALREELADSPLTLADIIVAAAPDKP